MVNRREFIAQAAFGAVTAANIRIVQAASATATTGPSAALKTYTIPHTGLKVSRLGYGSTSLISWDQNPVSGGDIDKAARLIHTACDNGITLFDHADLYAYG